MKVTTGPIRPYKLFSPAFGAKKHSDATLAFVVVNEPDELDCGPIMLFSQDVVNTVVKHCGGKAFKKTFKIVKSGKRQLPVSPYYIATPKNLFNRLVRRLVSLPQRSQRYLGDVRNNPSEN